MRKAACVEKLLEGVHAGYVNWVGGAGSQRITKLGQMWLARLMESSDLVPTCACQLGGEKIEQKNSGVCQHFCP